MRIRVLLFGPLAEMCGTREEWLELSGTPQAGDVYRHYLSRNTNIGKLENTLNISVNETIVGPDHPLAVGDEVALLPPVCGGSDQPADLIELVEVPLESHQWRSHFAASAEFGAVATFEGLVRKEDAADPVLALEFDAYRPMALSALHALAGDARNRWKIKRIVMLHRLGTVAAGEVCVVVAVATGHRDESFAACKFLIDTLKITVPIWKKEITASSSRWVDGVLLPAAK